MKTTVHYFNDQKIFYFDPIGQATDKPTTNGITNSIVTCNIHVNVLLKHVLPYGTIKDSFYFLIEWSYKRNKHIIQHK
ncbi:hypothetical protein BLOT_006304 [Blomia tropicalis]|nr:hypothetical protein BLOT_006304 [Blomia tropicalis]